MPSLKFLADAQLSTPSECSLYVKQYCDKKNPPGKSILFLFFTYHLIAIVESNDNTSLVIARYVGNHDLACFNDTLNAWLRAHCRAKVVIDWMPFPTPIKSIGDALNPWLEQAVCGCFESLNHVKQNRKCLLSAADSHAFTTAKATGLTISSSVLDLSQPRCDFGVWEFLIDRGLSKVTNITLLNKSLRVPGCAERQARPNILTAFVSPVAPSIKYDQSVFVKVLGLSVFILSAMLNANRFPTISALAVCPLSESRLGKLTWLLFTYTSITTLSLGCPNWHMNGSVLPRERPRSVADGLSLRLWGGQELALLRSLECSRESMKICALEVRGCRSLDTMTRNHKKSLWKNSRKLHLSIGFSAHNFGGETWMSAVEGYAFWGQLNSLYESDGLRFWVVLEVCKRRIDPVIEYDRVHGPLIVKELPYLRARGPGTSSVLSKSIVFHPQVLARMLHEQILLETPQYPAVDVRTGVVARRWGQRRAPWNQRGSSVGSGDGLGVVNVQGVDSVAVGADAVVLSATIPAASVSMPEQEIHSSTRSSGRNAKRRTSDAGGQGGSEALKKIKIAPLMKAR
ncbi:hypothetical protein C8J56DRAFT_899139 [Mycena floridula]|nr:hypothetical protein C8J56DRAFT_899139 [Mycena floridula]